MSTLTNDQITAGAADYTVDDSELARKIMVFLGQRTSGSMEPGADPLRDRLAERIALWRPAPSPQVAEKVKDAELIELAKLAGYTFARTTTAGVELLAGNVEAHERLMSFGALAIAASRRAAGGEASAALREAASDYANGTDWVQRSTVVAWLRARAGFATPAPASAGQAGSVLPEKAIKEVLRRAGDVLEGLEDMRLPGAMPVRASKLKAAVDDLAAEMVLVALAAQPAEVSAGQAGQVAKEPMDFDSFFEVVRASERAAAPADPGPGRKLIRDFDDIAQRFFKNLVRAERIKVLQAFLGWDDKTMDQVRTHSDERRCLKHVLSEWTPPVPLAEVCRNQLLQQGAPAIPKSCPRCGLAKNCPAGFAGFGSQA